MTGREKKKKKKKKRSKKSLFVFSSLVPSYSAELKRLFSVKHKNNSRRSVHVRKLALCVKIGRNFFGLLFFCFVLCYGVAKVRPMFFRREPRPVGERKTRWSLLGRSDVSYTCYFESFACLQRDHDRTQFTVHSGVMYACAIR